MPIPIIHLFLYVYDTQCFCCCFWLYPLGTSSLTHFLLPKWFKTFLTSTEIILNKTKSFLLKYQVSPMLKPSRNPCCFPTAWLWQPINWGLSSFTCTSLAGLSLDKELYLAPQTQSSLLFHSFSSPCLSPLPQTLFCHRGTSDSTHSFRFNLNPTSFGNSLTFPSQNSFYLC